MNYDKTMNRCEVIRSMILHGVEIKIEPTAENLEWIDACAEALEKQIELRLDYEGEKYCKTVKRDCKACWNRPLDEVE